MKKRSKRYKSIEIVEGEKSIKDALSLIKNTDTKVKFDESVEISFNLNLEKKHTVRDTVVFPNSFGKSKTVLVFARGKKAEEAKSAGADFVGAEDLIEKIQGGWLGFEVAIATIDMMKVVAKVARILGGKGLMPNPKAKTVTDDVTAAVKAVKAGRREFRANGEGVVNFAVGKKSMNEEMLASNIKEFCGAITKKKPIDLKGDYISSVYLSTTMGRSIAVDRKQLLL